MIKPLMFCETPSLGIHGPKTWKENRETARSLKYTRHYAQKTIRFASSCCWYTTLKSTPVFFLMVYIVSVWPSQSFVPMSASSSWRGVQCSQISNSPWTWHKTSFGEAKPAATGVFRLAEIPEIVDFMTVWHEAMDESIQMHQKSSKHPSSLLLLEEALQSTSTKIHSELAGIVQTCATDTVCFWLKMAKSTIFIPELLFSVKLTPPTIIRFRLVTVHDSHHGGKWEPKLGF